MTNNSMPSLRISGGKAILLFFIIMLIMMVISGIIGAIFLRNGMTTKAVRVYVVLQDIMMFIIPAIVAAMVSTSRPATLLAIDRSPGLMASAVAILALLFATPAINWIVEWNESLKLPESWAVIENWMKSTEESAQESVNLVLGGKSVGDLIIGVLAVGVMAGVSEELFFRGFLMRTLLASKVNTHAAVWLTAAIFSLFHFQFYGFIPRMLLGAYFGYLLLWSGSVWLPAAVHVFNNSVIVVSSWLLRCGYINFDINEAPSAGFVLIMGSVILTAGTIRAMRKHLFENTAGPLR